MGSHKHKKTYESDSSSSESEASSSSSSSDSRNKKKRHSKKSRQSSSEESENEKTFKSKSRRSSDESDLEKSKKKAKLVQESVDRNYDHKYKERDYRTERNKDEKYEERRYKASDTDRFKHSSGKSRDNEVDEFRNRRDFNNKERYEERDRNKRQDYRRDDRQSFRYQGNSRNYRDNNTDFRGRGRGGIRDRKNNNRRDNRGRRSSSFDHANAKWGKDDVEDKKKSEKREPQEKEKPNFGLTGKLTAETNTFKGIVIKYSEPPEARKPRRRWRLYPFKGEKALQTLYIHRESAYLIGRERKVVDLPVDHPSCSKQHAALQYRLVPFTREDGSSGKRVRPYIIDLDSANGTFINNKKIDSKRYVELCEKDVIKFGFSSREYVLLHENSKDEALDDDVKQEQEEIPIKDEPE